MIVLGPRPGCCIQRWYCNTPRCFSFSVADSVRKGIHCCSCCLVYFLRLVSRPFGVQRVLQVQLCVWLAVQSTQALRQSRCKRSGYIKSGWVLGLCLLSVSSALARLLACWLVGSNMVWGAALREVWWCTKWSGNSTDNGSASRVRV